MSDSCSSVENGAETELKRDVTDNARYSRQGHRETVRRSVYDTLSEPPNGIIERKRRVHHASRRVEHGRDLQQSRIEWSTPEDVPQPGENIISNHQDNIQDGLYGKDSTSDLPD